MIPAPLHHQSLSIDSTWCNEYWGYFFEQGLGKTKVSIEVAHRLHKNFEITGALVVAPSGVQLNWAYEEIPKHARDEYDLYVWDARQTKAEQRKRKRFLSKTGSMAWLLMNIEAIRTERGFKFAQDFLKSRDALMVVDESTIIKNPKAAQTKAAIRLGRIAKFRRILTGTPMTQGPLDLFSQCKFLSPSSIPYSSYTAFKNQFAVEQQMVLGSRSFNKVVGFRNLKLLETQLKPFTTRLTKEDCLDLPEKIYQKEFVTWHSDQERVYREIRDEQVSLLKAEKEENNGLVSVTSVLTAMVKLQQVCCGFVVDDDGVIHDIHNNRYKALFNLVDRDQSQKYVIWTTFRHTIKNIVRALDTAYGVGSSVSYYGETSSDGRTGAVESFRSDDNVRFFVANRTASKGLTLTKASRAIYFANSFSLEDRLQSEDRIHRIGQGDTCFYTDLIIPGSIEEKVLAAIRSIFFVFVIVCSLLIRTELLVVVHEVFLVPGR